MKMQNIAKFMSITIMKIQFFIWMMTSIQQFQAFQIACELLNSLLVQWNKLFSSATMGIAPMQMKQMLQLHNQTLFHILAVVLMIGCNVKMENAFLLNGTVMVSR